MNRFRIAQRVARRIEREVEATGLIRRDLSEEVRVHEITSGNFAMPEFPFIEEKSLSIGRAVPI